ncbi:MAG: DUF1592 domain-containing protein [Planctomycetes bacterium]|nr:DUF1592 domain-containing protein [Planctomycetota bacterium]
MMRRSILILPVFFLTVYAHAGAAETLRPRLEQHCFRCHGKGKKVEGKVNLVKAFAAKPHGLASDLGLIEKMIEKLAAGEMPPEDEKQPTSQQRDGWIAQLRGLLKAHQSKHPGPARVPMRRMNRFQYSNAVGDLFGLKVDVFALPERMIREHGNYFRPETGKMPPTLVAGSRPLGKSQLIGRRLRGVAPFPQDLRAEHGFDNQADHLTLSPLLMESFLKLSRSIVESPDFNANTCGIFNSFFAPPPENQNPAKKNTDEVVTQRLRQFLTRAFRRPVHESDLARYTRHVTAQIRSGKSFTDSMKEAASAALASPRFLYLYERAAGGDAKAVAKQVPLDDFELASRLSFFLWGSIPDQMLLDLAAKGELHKAEVLNRQLDRMLKDRRLKRFCDSFPAQWLQLERIISSVPDKKRFPKFYFYAYRTSMHMMLEPLLVFETILIENRPILELIDSDFSYRSNMLDKWYRDGPYMRGAVSGIGFRRVPIKDRRQGGVITTAAVMTMTSGTQRTKPVTRGAWVAAVIFNDPPNPPPDDVPPLPNDDAAQSKHLTIRERFEAHRSRAECKGCHAKIDPLGFALENYGVTGKWRDRYENGRKVDASGVLFKKHKFENVVEFKDAILAEKDRFARGFAAHLLSFALGRKLSAADSPALDTIVRETAAAEYRMQPLIKQVVLSKPFLTKFNPANPAKAANPAGKAAIKKSPEERRK